MLNTLLSNAKQKIQRDNLVDDDKLKNIMSQQMLYTLLSNAKQKIQRDNLVDDDKLQRMLLDYLDAIAKSVNSVPTTVFLTTKDDQYSQDVNAIYEEMINLFLAFVVTSVRGIALKYISKDETSAETLKYKYTEQALKIGKKLKSLHEHFSSGTNEKKVLRDLKNKLGTLFNGFQDDDKIDKVAEIILRQCIQQKSTTEMSAQTDEMLQKQFQQNQEQLRQEQERREAIRRKEKEKCEKIKNFNENIAFLKDKYTNYKNFKDIFNSLNGDFPNNEKVEQFGNKIKSQGYDPNKYIEDELWNSLDTDAFTCDDKTSRNVTENAEYLKRIIKNLPEWLKNAVNLKEDLRGAVRIFVRVKPIALRSIVPINYDFGNKVITFNQQRYGPFYDIYNDRASNRDLFNSQIDMFRQILDGYHIVLFGYGYSGSGKTYTLINNTTIVHDQNNGLALHALSFFIEHVLPNNITIHQMFELYVKDFKNVIPVVQKQNQNPNLTGQKIDLLIDIEIKRNVDEFNKTNKDNKINLFNDVISFVNKHRINKKRIRETINNKESSRSHLFIILKIGDGYLTICDMGGRENPYDIYNNTYITNNGINFNISSEKGKTMKELLGYESVSAFYYSFDQPQSVITQTLTVRMNNFDLYKQIKTDTQKAMKKNALNTVKDVLDTCREGFYINETINHLIYYFNKLNNKAFDVKFNRSMEFNNIDSYKVQNFYNDPTDKDDKILMIKTLNELKDLKSQHQGEDKPTKFVMYACIRQEKENKFIEFGKSTLEFAQAVASTVA